MRHSLHAHILYLENTIQDLRSQLTGPRPVAEAQEIELQLALAEGALTRYREAYALEQSVSCSGPSGAFGSKSSGSGDSDLFNSEKKWGTHSEILARVRRATRRSPSTLRNPPRYAFAESIVARTRPGYAHSAWIAER